MQFPTDPFDIQWERFAVPESKDPLYLIKFKSKPKYSNVKAIADVDSNAASRAFDQIYANKYKDTAIAIDNWIVCYSQSIWTGSSVAKPTTEHSRVAGIAFRIALKVLLLTGCEFEVE